MKSKSAEPKMTRGVRVGQTSIASRVPVTCPSREASREGSERHLLILEGGDTEEDEGEEIPSGQHVHAAGEIVLQEPGEEEPEPHRKDHPPEVQDEGGLVGDLDEEVLPDEGRRLAQAGDHGFPTMAPTGSSTVASKISCSVGSRRVHETIVAPERMRSESRRVRAAPPGSSSA